MGGHGSASIATSSPDRLEAVSTTRNPRRASRRGFHRPDTPCREADVVLVVRRAETLGRRNWSERYYLCSEDDQLAWRIPKRLHGDLVATKVAFPQFAGTKQRVLEVFFTRAPGGSVLIDARGTFYTFTSDGKFDPRPFVEAATSALEGSRPRRVQDHVIDITPTVRNRRWIGERTSGAQRRPSRRRSSSGIARRTAA